MLPLRELRYFRNRLLQNFDEATVARLHLRPVRLAAGQKLYRLDDVPKQILFLETGVAALSVQTYKTPNGEAGLAGNHTALGLAGLVNGASNPYAATMLTDGIGYCCTVENGKLEFARGANFQEMALRTLHDDFARALKLAVCNATHSIENRLSRWLIECSDLMDTHEVAVTQETLAQALQVRRSTICMAMDSLRHKGALSSSRGKINIGGYDTLRALACCCALSTGNRPAVSRSDSTPVQAA